MKIHKTRGYVRYRIRDPSLFKRSSFRVHDIGRKGHTKRIAGQLKKSGKWATQAYLINKEDYKKGLRVMIENGRPKLVMIKK